MEPPAHPASTTGPYEDIIEALLALDAGALADGVPGILAQHEDRLDRGFVAALRARADAEGERAPATNLLAIALFVENGLDQVERERPTQEQCEFVHRLLTLFLGANTEEHLEAARAAVVAEIRAHPELTGEALPNAVRGVASVLGGTGIPPRPGLLRIVITLGIAALRHWVRWAGHTRLCLAFTQLGWAFARCPDLGVHGSVREAAVASCRAGLELLPPYVLRGHRAEALNTLGMALTGREMGDREENLREAAEHYRAALRVLDKNPHFLTQWACTQTNLAGALHTMARGDQRARQAEAFEALDAGLAVLDRPAWRDAFRDEWARGQMLLGMLLIEHIGGDRPENLARAADALVKAMNVWIEQDRAGELASTANALGLVFAAMGDPGSVARAVESFEMALRHRRRDTHPLEWASTLSNLAATRLRLADQVQHEAAIEQLEQAVRELGDAAELLAQYELSYWLAITRGNQAAAHLALARRQGDDGRDLLESNVFRALSATWYAESVLTRGAFPREWARMRHLCGMAHLQRGGRDPLSGADDAVLGLQALADALQVLTPAAYPHDALVTARVMGVAAAERGDWELAVTGYTRAVEAAEQLRRQATAEARRDEIIASAADAFAGLVRSLLHAGRPAEALAAAERGKARELSELLAEQNLRPSAAVPQAEVEELGRARAAELSAVRILSAAQLRQEISGGGDEPGDATLAEHVAAVEVARAAVDRALTAIQARDPAFALAQAESPPPTPDELAALLPDDHTALLSLYAGGNVHAFVLTRAGVRVEVTPDDEREALERALVAYFEAFAAAGSPEWWLDERLGAVINATEFVSRALALLPDHVDRLLLVPHQHLHLLPLHALKVAGQMLVDRFPRGVAYAPSARLLGLAQGRERRAFDFLMAVQDPASNGADPLPAADQEVTMVAERFTHPPRVLRGEEATRAALLGAPELLTANALHFACHGQFEPANPLDSALLLAGDDELTLAEVFALELDDCRLAVLSACGTGRVGVGNTEEYVGLPAGFLYAGSAAVVSSLWSVDDVSTALLAARMYHRLRERGDPCAPYAVAEALAFAQRWLRDSTTTELENWLGEHYPDTLAPYAERMRSGARRRRRGPSEDEAGEWYPDDCPFAEPFYWAPFIATGC